MTLFSLRTALALLLAASLASCGGGSSKATFAISGNVSGLAYNPLVLKAGTQTVNVAPSTTNTADTLYPVTYTFPQTIEYGEPYLVELGVNPPHQECTVLQTAADSAGHTATINIAVTCTTNSYTVNGYVHGLAADNLQLINGSTSGTITVTQAGVLAAQTAEAAGTVTPSFSFPATFYNQAYGVTILTQPTGQTCTVTNGSGVINESAILNISVDCVTNPT